MKKSVKILIATLILATVCLFSACSITVTDYDFNLIVIDSAEEAYTFGIKTDNTVLKTIMDEMVTEGAKYGKTSFNYTFSEGDYGSYITGMLDIEVPENYYWMLYSSIKDEEKVSLEYTYTYKNATYYSLNSGISGYETIDDEKIIVVLQTFSY